ncbi:DNA-3-methyladenine glycosylase I [Thermoproteota archaeon]
MPMEKILKRCWKTSNPIYIKYHDEEWGVPVHDDDRLFEFLTLGGFQAGLTWELILNKRDAFREAFHNFDPKIIAQYDQNKIEDLMSDSRLIRNKAKILATIHNAQLVLNIQREYGSFDSFLWSVTNGKRLNHSCNSFSELPTESTESRAMNKELKKKGFKFVGPTICYAFMQAVGIINDHLIQCFRYNEIAKINK